MAISMSASKFATYRLCRALIVLAALAPVSALGADVLPLERGRYFDVGVACESPGKATVFVYDGTGFSHEKTNCSLDRLTGSGGVYAFRETCAYRRRSWSVFPTAVNEFSSTFQVHGRREFTLRRENEGADMTGRYRLCTSR
ncbi:hypothetical protein B0E45_16885 [Sinorhizobium sp. A49]|nr:hypothetical protein B0E45_16885 [Sinorhizobium sp. A49]